MANLGYIQVTRICNQKCLFCSNPENQQTLSSEKAVEQARTLLKSGYDGVILTGGEPTLHPRLREIIRSCVKLGIAVRMITNGQRTANRRYLKGLMEAGLEHLHVSIHSMKESVQAHLTGNRESLKNIRKTLRIAGNLGLSCDVNTVICAQNAAHLDKNVIQIVRDFPHVRHFVFNMIDPKMNRVEENPHTVARLADVELPLFRALRFLSSVGRTFRVERLPLCYMTDFAFASTETRKIVKKEERTVHFLDEKGSIRQTDFFHEKGFVCKRCFLDHICAGLYDLGGKYREEELYPVFVSPEEIIEMIRRRRE
ncbi:MAG: radical SAM protein [Myxococcales bacterium]|nr:radical SAM protein [Myxococcales bacterium]